MNFGELKAHCMAQINADGDDLQDFLPFLSHYLNEGYDILIGVWEPGKHVEWPAEGEAAAYPVLRADEDMPHLPYWIHRFIADHATWLLYRNGNPQRQSRGERYRLSFEEAKARLMAEGGMEGAGDDGHERMKHIVNVYPDRPQRYEPEPQPLEFDPLA